MGQNKDVVYVWVLGVVFGLTVAVLASRVALDAASALGRALGLSPFVIGVTIMAIGTDLPEMANSIVASGTDHGEINVGDSIGSVVTQATVVLGLLCLTGKLTSPRRFVITTGSLTVLALLIGAVLIGDNELSHADGALLIAVWLTGTLIIQRPTAKEKRPQRSAQHLGPDIWRTIAALVMVGAGATLAVESFARAATEFGMPEYLLSFFVLAAGTSLPELVVDYRAIRQGEAELAMGDLLGSSFVDATLSLGIGPLIFSSPLPEGLARGSVLVALVLAAVTAVLARDTVHRWPTGLVLILLYLALYPALIV